MGGGVTPERVQWEQAVSERTNVLTDRVGSLEARVGTLEQKEAP